MTTYVSALGHVPQWTFGDRIRKIRREADLTQAQFAQRLGYSDKQVGQWEAGRNQPEDIVEIARRVHREFGVLPSWTLDFDSGPPGEDGSIPVRRERLERPTRWLDHSPSHSHHRSLVSLSRLTAVAQAA